MPKSGGRPYEVLTVDDQSSVLQKILSEDVKGLPQPEPSFDVSTISKKSFKKTEKLARAIVFLDVDSTLYTRTSIRYERDVYAKPQIIIRLTTPSTESVEKSSESKKTIIRLLTRFEMNAEIAYLKKKHNLEAERRIKEIFQIDMLVPANLQASKTGKNFIWFSNNAGSGMQNICIYTIPNEEYIEGRDSVMKMNIPGEEKGMFMKTVGNSTTMEQTNKRTIIRGLWEMENDAMGGPFVLHAIRKGTQIIVVEAFVYAPEMRKRNKIQQLEAALYTMKIEN